MDRQDEILQDEKVLQLLDRMRALCSVREYCTKDISEKVLKVVGEEEAAVIIDVLKTDDFLSDRRYAAAFARDKAHLLGWGPQKIRYALLSKHIDEATVNAALASVDQCAAQSQLERMLARKLASLRSSGKSLPANEIKARLIRFATGRGYSYDAIVAAIGRLPKDSLE